MSDTPRKKAAARKGAAAPQSFGDMELVPAVLLPLSALEPNKGQIPGLPKNPRTISEEKYRKLKKSITEQPQMMALREIVVIKHGEKYVIAGGNMRFRALKELGYTDPPYNVDYSAKNEVLNKADKGNRIQKDIANDKMTREQFGIFLNKAFEGMYRIAKPGAGIYIFYASREAVNFVQAFEGAGFEYKQQLIWVKNNMVLGLQDYQRKHEPILYGWKGGKPHYFVDRRDQLTVWEDAAELDPDKMSKDELKKALKDLLEAAQVPNTAIHENKPQVSADHPTMKPVKLVGRLLKNSTRPGEMVVDIFGGSGSTLIAADQLGRACFTVELDPQYSDVIIKRWEKQSGEKAQYIGNYVAARGGM